jgi:predicted  nucleic acid-binding Zn-ribbon protein
MTNRVSVKEAEVIAPTEAVHSMELDKVIAEKENVNKHIESLRQNIDQKREKVYSLASNSIQLREKMASMSASSQVSDARTSYALSLYGKISNIAWDYSSPRGRLSGRKLYAL